MEDGSVHILLVEDDEAHAELIRRSFEEFHRSHTPLITAVTTLKQARQYLRETFPDLMIVDLALPDGNGVDLLPAKYENVFVPAIIMTCHGSEQMAVKAMKAGAVDYVIKSKSTFQDIPRIVAQVLQERDHIKECRRMEEELHQAQKDWENIFQAIGHPTMILDTEYNIQIANRAMLRLTGMPQEELQKKKCYEVFHKANHEPQQCPLQQMIQSGHLETVEMELEALEGTFLVSCTPILDQQGRLEKIIHIATDITERKIAERQKYIYEEQLRSLASELSLVEERQRRNIATSLHDNVGQTLALSKMKLGFLRQQASAMEIGEPIREIAEMIEKTIDYTRDLTFQLSPPILYEVGLEAALQWLLDEIKKQQQIETGFKEDGQKKPLDDNVRVFLFQAVRELLFNITKHAKAHYAEIQVNRTDSNIQITVEDDGIGFDVELLNHTDRRGKGFGLFNIHERLDYLGGKFRIRLQTGKGTTVTLIAPLQVNS